MIKFDDNRIMELKGEVAKMYSMVLGVSTVEFVAKLVNIFNFDEMDLLIVKLLEDAGFDMNKIGTYFFGIIAKNQYSLNSGCSGVKIANGIRFHKTSSLIKTGYDKTLANARKFFNQIFNYNNIVKVSKNEISLEQFEGFIDDAVRTSFYAGEGLELDEIMISFVRDMQRGESSHKNFDISKLIRERRS